MSKDLFHTVIFDVYKHVCIGAASTRELVWFLQTRAHITNKYNVNKMHLNHGPPKIVLNGILLTAK
jgi:hypothetical protein